MQDFRQLQVWQKAHQLALDVYAETATFPKSEIFGITSQMRRAAVSIAANIVEGSSRKGDKEFGRFLQVALASFSELEYLTILVSDLKLLENRRAVKLGGDAVKIRRMLYGLLSTLK